MGMRGIAGKAGAAIAAGALTACLMAAPLALAIEGDGPVEPAGEVGTLAIYPQEGNDVTYDAIALFRADVDKTGKAIHIQWASEEAKAAVEGAIKAVDPEYAGDTSQEAAEFIAANWIEGADYTTIVEFSEFPNQLAAACQGLPVAATLKAGESTELEEGYYLVLTTPATLDADSEAGTSAIYTAVMKGNPVEIDEKTALPTVTKEVVEDSTGEFGTHADANRLQELDYRITGTVSGNVATFGSYFYQIVDTMTGLSLEGDDTSSVVVKIDGSDVTELLSDGELGEIAYADGVLTVTFNNLKGLQNQLDGGTPIAITPSTVVTVEYRAHLTADAVTGAVGNPNEVVINYSNNPNNESHGKTIKVVNTVYAFAIDLHKVDAVTAESLAGAKFTIAAAEGGYVQADGSVAEAAYEFETNGNGVIVVAGLDEGTYTIHETQAPTDYAELTSDFTFSIVSTYDPETGELTGLGVEAANSVPSAPKVDSVDVETGTISITITNDKIVEMPVTGMGGITWVYIVGGIVIAASVAALLIRRHRKSS